MARPARRGPAGPGLRVVVRPGRWMPQDRGCVARARRPLAADQSARDRIRSCVFGWASMGWAGSAGTSCAASSTATSQHSRSWQSTTWRPWRPSRTCCITTRPTGRGIAASRSQATSSTIRCGRWSPDPALLAWGALGVDVVVDATGKFRTRERAAAHRGSPQGGAHRTRHRRRRNDRAGRQPGRLRRHDAPHHLQRLEHHELRGTDGAGAAPRLRDRGRPAHWTGSRCGSRSWTPRWST
ncbi:MAG: Glyceraldehyde 3-phosphate dehydrogenase, binding domain [Pseudonocardia sp.]|nr:Glyceraldehyde 3-phosphate dehydrogenase, binding domain [Pseudonocardia sp.]